LLVRIDRLRKQYTYSSDNIDNKPKARGIVPVSLLLSRLLMKRLALVFANCLGVQDFERDQRRQRRNVAFELVRVKFSVHVVLVDTCQSISSPYSVFKNLSVVSDCGNVPVSSLNCKSLFEKVLSNDCIKTCH
jgi:hypothetical protein